MRKKIILCVCGAVVVAAAVAITVLVVRSLPHGESFYEPIVAGQVYRTRQPRDADWAWMRQHLGIRTVVDLRGVEDEGFDPKREEARVVGAGMNHVLIAINGRSPKPEDIARFLEVISDPANKPALIHCAAGRIRSGMMVAVYRMEFQGWSNQRAVEEFRTPLRGGDQHAAAEQFILGYVRRNAKTPTTHPARQGSQGSLDSEG